MKCRACKVEREFLMWLGGHGRRCMVMYCKKCNRYSLYRERKYSTYTKMVSINLLKRDYLIPETANNINTPVINA